MRITCAALVLVAAASCRSFQPEVFDSRLRAATVDAYVEAIRTQFGGLDAAGVTADQLRRRYRAEAIGAETPSRFYGVLRALLADLDDPHATLRVSPRFWSGPVAEPEWIQFARSRDAVWVGVPDGSIRSDHELDVAFHAWVEQSVESASRVAEVLDTRKMTPVELASFLRHSAVFAGAMRANRFAPAMDLREPLRWFRLRAIDGIPIESPHDAELLARGELATVVRMDVMGEGDGRDAAPTRIALLRNAGVFEDEAAHGVRRRLHPLELAHMLDPGREGWAPGDAARTPDSLLRARRYAEFRGPLRRGHPLPLTDPAAELFGLEAWTLFTEGGRTVDYLRIGSFRPRDPSTGERVSGDLDPTLHGALEEAFARMAPISNLVIDLTGNPGGSWQETGLFISYFLDPSYETVPHVVESVRETSRLFLRVRTRERQRLARVDVDRIAPDSVLILVDQDTASAGEIAASALRGLIGAKLVGERTAGAEFSTGEFLAPDGSLLRIGLAGGMEPPLESFQGVGLAADVRVRPRAKVDEEIDLESWRASFRYLALERALRLVDEGAAGDLEASGS